MQQMTEQYLKIIYYMSSDLKDVTQFLAGYEAVPVPVETPEGHLDLSLVVSTAYSICK